MSLREHEIDQILKMSGLQFVDGSTGRQVRDAIKYAYEMGYTDGTQGDPMPRLVPVGSILQSLVKPSPEPWCRDVFLYSPENASDSPERRVQLYALEADIKGRRKQFRVYLIQGHCETGEEAFMVFLSQESAEEWLQQKSHADSLKALQRTAYAYTKIGYMFCSEQFHKDTVMTSRFVRTIQSLKELTT